MDNEKKELQTNSTLTPANYIGDNIDIQARQAIEMVNGNINKVNDEINRLFYGNIIESKIKQELITYKEETKQEILDTINPTVQTTVRAVMDDRGLSKYDDKRLKKLRDTKFAVLLQHNKNDIQKDSRYVLFLPYYQNAMKRDFCKKFHATSYADIKPTQFMDASEFIKNWDISKKDKEKAEWGARENYKKGFNNYTNVAVRNKMINAFEYLFLPPKHMTNFDFA